MRHPAETREAAIAAHAARVEPVRLSGCVEHQAGYVDRVAGYVDRAAGVMVWACARCACPQDTPRPATGYCPRCAEHLREVERAPAETPRPSREPIYDLDELPHRRGGAREGAGRPPGPVTKATPITYRPSREQIEALRAAADAGEGPAPKPDGPKYSAADRGYRCEVCGAVTPSATGLKIHMGRRHGAATKKHAEATTAPAGSGAGGPPPTPAGSSPAAPSGPAAEDGGVHAPAPVAAAAPAAPLEDEAAIAARLEEAMQKLEAAQPARRSKRRRRP